MNAQFVNDCTRSVEKHNAHFQLCIREKQPFVTVWPKSRYAQVAIDVDSIDAAISEEGQELIRQVFAGANGVEIHTCGGLCSAKKIPVHDAEDVARKIFQIAKNFQTKRQ